MFCTQCGKKISDDAHFCPHCGSPTGGAPIVLRTGTSSEDPESQTNTPECVSPEAGSSEASVATEMQATGINETPNDATVADEDASSDVSTIDVEPGDIPKAAVEPSSDEANSSQESAPTAPASTNTSQTTVALSTAVSSNASQANTEPSPGTATGDIGTQVAEARKSAKRKIPLFLLVVLAALGVAGTAFAATITWRYVIAPAIEAVQIAFAEATANGADNAGATGENANADEHKQTQTSGALQQYGDTLYRSSYDQGDISGAFSGNATTLPVDTNTFVIYDDRIYYAAQPDVKRTSLGTITGYTGGGIYSCNLDGSDTKLLCSDNAYTSDFYGTNAVASPFYISNNKLCYTALDDNERGKLVLVDETAYKVISLELESGNTSTLANGKILSGSGEKLAIRKIRESWSENDNSGNPITYYGYSYSLIYAENGDELCSLDDILPKETSNAYTGTEYGWYVYVMDDTLLCVEGIGGNGSKQSDVPIVKATLADDNTIANTETMTSSTFIPFNDSIIANYAERTVSFVVEEPYTKNYTQLAKSLVTVHADDFSISTEPLD